MALSGPSKMLLLGMAACYGQDGGYETREVCASVGNVIAVAVEAMVSGRAWS